MIRPNMATMLGFIATDAAIAARAAATLARAIADDSFNRITDRRRHVDQRLLRR